MGAPATRVSLTGGTRTLDRHGEVEQGVRLVRMGVLRISDGALSHR